MTIKMGRYRYWGDQKPDTTRPLLTFTRTEAVAATSRSEPAAAPASSGTLRIYGPIDSWGGFWGVSAKEVAQALDLLGDAEQIVVRINSPGGESSEGRAIMNLLRAHKAKCIGVVDGAAYSAASYIAVGCEETVMSPGTTLMIHDTHAFVYGDAAALRKEADVIDQISLSGAELYAEVAGGTVEQWRELQRAETWYTAATAVTAGLADRVAVVPDAGPAETAGDEGPEPVDESTLSERAQASYDLSLFDKAPEWAAPKPPTASAGGSTETEGGSAVAFSDEQLTTMRQELGLPEDADEATIVAALSEALSEAAEPKAAAPAVPEGMALVDAAVLTELRTGAEAGRTAREELDNTARDRAVEAAIKAGKTTPARREHWIKSWQADPEGTRTLLESLEPGLVPVAELGHALNRDDTDPAGNVDDAVLEAYAASIGLSKEDLRG